MPQSMEVLFWLVFIIAPAQCQRSAGKENKFGEASFDTLKPGVHGWMALDSAEHGDPASVSQPMTMPPADSPKHPTMTRERQKSIQISAMHAIKKRNLGDTREIQKSAEKGSNKKQTKKNLYQRKYDFDMKPSIHTIVACITAMMVVFHIIICLSVWQQCKSHNNPQMIETLAVDPTPPPRPRHRHSGEQSFSVLVEEPPLVGEVPLPPAYKEGESSKPPSYDNIQSGSNNNDRTRAN